MTYLIIGLTIGMFAGAGITVTVATLVAHLNRPRVEPRRVRW